MAEDTSAHSPSIADLLTRSIAALPALGAWTQRSPCADAEPDIFFPSHGDTGEQARQICVGCAVRSDCLEYAIEADEFGIWGGLDQRERRNLRRRRHRKEAATCAKGGQSEGAA